MTSVGGVSAPAAPAATGLLEVTLDAARARADGAGPAFLRGLRAEALAWLETRGFPGPKDEEFRLTPLRAVLREPYREADGNEGTEAARGASDRVVMVDGRPRIGTSVSKDLEVVSLSEVLRTSPARVEPWLGRVAPLAHGFDAQNAALFGDAVVIFARAQGNAGTLRIIHETGKAAHPALSVPRMLVVLEEGSALTLIETREGGSAKRLESSVTEIVVGRGARLDHVRLVQGTSASASLSTVGVWQERDSRYASRVFTFGGSPSRLDLRVQLRGEGAECVLDGLFVARQGDQVDHHTRVDHTAPRCTSREQYKGILDGDGLSVFDGTVVVRHGASGTAAHQESRNLLLSNDAVAHAKPHLEIDTDDVKCSHGATVGRLDPAQLFYLRSRGLDAEVARAVLTLAFGREVIARVTDEATREHLDRVFSSLLPGGLAAREVT